MIGPHAGKELELMLSGEKKLAVFSDIVQENHSIPENKFSHHVKSGRLKHFEKNIKAIKAGETIRYVCFTTPKEEWRANTYLRIKQETLTGKRPHDTSDDIIIGHLLGYGEEDIADYIAQL